MMKRWTMALRYMLAASASWYLPALFLACLSWAMAFQVLDVVRQRPVARRIYVLMPPVLTLGLLLSRASDLFGLDPHHPEVATVLGSSASTGERLQLLLTGQGAIEGALLAFFVFAVLSPRLPSLRAASEPTRVAVQGKMMSHAGWWALIALMMLFDPAAYEPMTAPPETPTVALSTWDAFGWVVLFTLLLMMAGEILTATAHMASSGETNLLFHRALLKTAVAGLVGWLVLSQTAVFEPSWWARPTTDARLAMGASILVYTTLMASMHAFSTVAEGLHSAAARQATSLGWSLALITVLLVALTSNTAHQAPAYGTGTDALLTGWRWAALALIVAAGAMILPMAGFDAAHHPEAWWFRAALMMFLPIAALVADGGWLLLPATLVAGGVFPTVHVFMMADGKHRTVPFVVALGLVIACLLVVVTSPQASLFFAAASTVLISLAGAGWYRRERRNSVGESVL